MTNDTTSIPFLPTYILAYWLVSLIFHLIDHFHLFESYRIHTPEEFKHRNRVTVAQVLRSVLLQQAIQTVLGLFLGRLTDAGDFKGREDYDIAVWAGRVRGMLAAVQGGVAWAAPSLLALLGLDVGRLSSSIQTFAASSSSTMAAAWSSSSMTGAKTPLVLMMNSMVYPHLGDGLTYGFRPWEIWIAKAVYWVLEPAARFGFAVAFSDSWQYFWHRAMHTNRWMFLSTKE
ncbi:MAG: hypothetical protein Q9168_006587 [Polycauliona sp. 1 TL-2023]